MDCDACAKMIELDLEDQGIVAKCNYERQELAIEENGVPFEKIQKTIEAGGYKLIKN